MPVKKKITKDSPESANEKCKQITKALQSVAKRAVMPEGFSF